MTGRFGNAHSQFNSKINTNRMAVNSKSALLLLLLGFISSSSCTIQQLHILFRHGERSPTETYPNDPHIKYQWSGGWGQLTNAGKLQMYELGHNLRDRYHNFIPEYYYPDNTSYYSSYAYRCLMSAQLVSAGLFPPRDHQIWNNDLLWQPVPVTYLPRAQDNFIAMKQKCPKYDKEYNRVLNSPEVQQIKDDNRDLFELLTNNTGLNVTTLAQVETLFNTLEIEQLNGLEIPDWATQAILARMKILGTKNLALYSDNTFMKRMKGGVWIKRVLQSIDAFQRKGKEPSLNMYSGHDFSLVQILLALNLEALKPQFGAAIALELHQGGLIKLFWWDNYVAQPVEIFVPGCSTNCTVATFRNVLKSYIPDDWASECVDV